jgi:DNA repair exonuclease SbcCD ATPase subunit
MRLKSLAIDRIPGFKRTGFSLKEEHIGEGINVIIGPNGSGKTTICKAISASLWPHAFKDLTPLTLSSIWEEQDGKVEIFIDGQHQTISRNLELPPWHLSRCFIITLDELFHATDHDFAKEIFRQASGGYDLSVLTLERPRYLGREEWKRVAEAKQQQSAVSSRHRELLERELKLQVLQEEIAKANAAKGEIDKIDALLNQREIERKLQSCQEALAALPPQLKDLRGNEKETLLELEQKIAQWGEEFKKITIPIGWEEARLQIEEALLTVFEIEKEIKRTHSEIEKNRAANREYFRFFKTEPFEMQGINELLNLWRKWQKLLAEEREIEAKIAILPKKAAYLSSRLQEGIMLCERIDALTSLKLGIYSALALLLSSFILTLLSHPLFALTALPILFFLFFTHTKKAELQKQFAKFELPQNTQILRELLSESVLYEANQALEQDLNARKERLQDEKKRSALFFEEINPHLHLDDHLGAFLENFDRFYQSYVEEKRLESAKEELTRQLAAQWEIIQPFIPGTSAYEAKKKFDAISELAREKAQLAFKLDQVKSERERFLDICDGQPLDFLLDKLALYRSLMEQKNQLEGQRALYHCCDEGVEKEELLRRREEQEELSKQYEELVQKHAAVVQEIKGVSSGSEMQRAEEGVRNARKELKSKYELACESYFTDFLLESIEKEYQTLSHSLLLQRADQWLMRFTHGAYCLRALKGKEAEFAAFDAVSEEVKPLDQLSRGTRLQLLLAIRLSFTALFEDPRNPFPLFFDEALANFDMKRFGAVSSALVEMAKAGRQIFYFSCRPEEASYWKRAVEKEKVNLHCIDLEKIKLDQEALIDARAASASEIPSPSGRSLSDYAALFTIPALNVADSIGKVDLYHLVSSSDELCHFYRLNIRTLGQLKSLLGHEIGLTKEASSLLKCKTAILEHYFQLANIGRGKSLSRTVLEKAGFSAKFIDPIYERAAAHDFHARELFASLENEKVKNLRENTLTKAKAYLIEEGYLDERSALSSSDLYDRLFHFATPFLDKKEISLPELTSFMQSILL